MRGRGDAERGRGDAETRLSRRTKVGKMCQQVLDTSVVIKWNGKHLKNMSLIQMAIQMI